VGHHQSAARRGLVEFLTLDKTYEAPQFCCDASKTSPISSDDYAEFRLATGSSGESTGVSEMGARCAILLRLRLLVMSRSENAMASPTLSLMMLPCLACPRTLYLRSLMDSSSSRLYPPQRSNFLLVSRPRENKNIDALPGRTQTEAPKYYVQFQCIAAFPNAARVLSECGRIGAFRGKSR
jgi:hypothetical protein